MTTTFPPHFLAVAYSWQALVDQHSFPTFLDDDRKLQRYLSPLLALLQEAEEKSDYQLQVTKIDWATADELVDDVVKAAHEVQRINNSCQCQEDPGRCNVERRALVEQAKRRIAEEGPPLRSISGEAI